LGAWSEAAPAAQNGRDSLALRLVSGAVFVPLFILLAWRGGAVYLGFVLLFVCLGLLEFYRLLEAKGERPYRGLGLVAGLLLVVSIYFRLGLHANLLLTLVLMITMVSELLRSDNRGAVHAIGGTLFGVFYVAWLGSHLVFLRELPLLAGLDYGLGGRLVLFLFLCAWGCDTGAYLTGRAWGRHPLLPRVSPKKSVEGAIGGVLAGGGLGLVGALSFVPFLGPGRGFLCGLLIAVSGEIGDLVESLLKRDAACKDSAAAMTIPGHGGVLDRFDSILFAAPAFYYVLRGILL
jgi:phosphatidate cytidylyltransferase